MNLRRGGSYFRVYDPSWKDPMDTSYSKTKGGRWNPSGEFGALYMNQTIVVAAANARCNYESEIATLFDLRPEQRPNLLVVDIAGADFLDAVSAAGLKALKLPDVYPLDVSWGFCQDIARRSYRAKGNGVASLSYALAREERTGEELAIFDRSVRLATVRRRLRFSQWYPTETPLRHRSG